MLVYLINLLIVVLSAYLAKKSKSVVMSRCLLGIAFISMVLVAGLRDRTVGTDSGSYVATFEKIQTLQDVVTYGNRMGEWGFWILTWLAHIVSNEYAVYFTFIALVFIGCLMRVITLYSSSITISLFLFISLGFYGDVFNGARQAIACGVFFLAIGPMLEGNFKKFLGYILIAFLFHKTAIMALPAYLIFNRPNNLKNNLFIVFIGCVGLIFFERIVAIASTFDDRYAAYGVIKQGGGFNTVFVSISIAAFFLLFRRHVQINRVWYDRCLNVFLFGVMIGVVSSILNANPSGILRYRIYFTQFMLFLWPIVFQNITNRTSKFLALYIFVVVFLTFFVLTTQVFSNLIPYRINPYFEFIK